MLFGRLGVVGHEQAKFTPHTEQLARQAINDAIDRHKPVALVSGHCPLGGVDIYAEEIARERGLEMIVHAPKTPTWNGPGGYRERNLRIAHDSDLVLVVALRELPPGFIGMRHKHCYHCRSYAPPTDLHPTHVKGGGCWTAWQCRAREWAIIQA